MEKQVITFNFKGVDGFEEVRPAIWGQFAHNTHFLIALGEAVCNAIRYGNGGIDSAKVEISIKANERFIIAKIVSDSKGFDVEAKLKNLPTFQDLHGKNRGRGIGIIKNCCKKVVFNQIGNEVILGASRRYKESIKNCLF